MKIVGKNFFLEIHMNFEDIIKVITDKGEILYVVCKEGRLIIKETL